MKFHRLQALLFLLTAFVFESFVIANFTSSFHHPDLHNNNNHADSSTTPSWEDLDRRPLPRWYDEAKFGIFIHWGVFSVPSFGTSAWLQSYWQSHWEDVWHPRYVDFINRTERSNFAYADYAHRFTADLYRPDEWVELFASSGAQYVVLTAKHHDGYCNWNSTEGVPLSWNWNSMDVGPRRDLVGELAAAVRQTQSPLTQQTLRFGLYHSLLEWFNPLYLRDQRNQWETREFANLKTIPELYDLVHRYAPEILWSDGHWETTSEYWQAREFLHWVSTNSSVADTVVWNDRWGNDTNCRHGSFLNCHDRFTPDGVPQRKWENALTIDADAWAYNRNATRLEDFHNVTSLIHTLIHVVAYNGNLLLNVGPAADGTIHPIFADRLTGIGNWLKVNGNAIFATRPWTVTPREIVPSPSGSTTTVVVYYTTRADRLYAIMTAWPAGSLLTLSSPQSTNDTSVEFLGLESSAPTTNTDKNTLVWRRHHKGLAIQLPLLTPDLIPCQHAWVLVLRGICNLHDANQQWRVSDMREDPL